MSDSTADPTASSIALVPPADMSSSRRIGPASMANAVKAIRTRAEPRDADRARHGDAAHRWQQGRAARRRVGEQPGEVERPAIHSRVRRDLQGVDHVAREHHDERGDQEREGRAARAGRGEHADRDADDDEVAQRVRDADRELEGVAGRLEDRRRSTTQPTSAAATATVAASSIPDRSPLPTRMAITHRNATASTG